MRYPEVPVITVSLEDVGTRQDHLTELLDLWNTALSFLLSKPYHSDQDTEMIEKLTVITEFLKRTMTNMLGPYNEAFYKTLVDSLPRDPKEITE